MLVRWAEMECAAVRRQRRRESGECTPRRWAEEPSATSAEERKAKRKRKRRRKTKTTNKQTTQTAIAIARRRASEQHAQLRPMHAQITALERHDTRSLRISESVTAAMQQRAARPRRDAASQQPAVGVESDWLRLSNTRIPSRRCRSGNLQTAQSRCVSLCRARSRVHSADRPAIGHRASESATRALRSLARSLTHSLTHPSTRLASCVCDQLVSHSCRSAEHTTADSQTRTHTAATEPISPLTDRTAASRIGSQRSPVQRCPPCPPLPK